VDISVRIFIAPDEYTRFLEQVSTEGGAILYEPGLGAPYRRVEPGSPLPQDLVELISSPWEVDSPHVILVGVDDPASDPRALAPNRLITAYFGGFDRRALYIKRLKAISRTGIEAWGEPAAQGETGQSDRSARYTDGALRLVQSGLQLRQRGVGRVHFEIAQGSPHPR
jgi:hypothetical protein